jgi:hypothetical protein
MKVPLAGGDAAGNPTETLLSEVGLVLLKMFDMREACVLRLVCREFVEAVRLQQWEDGATVIRGSIAAWRACFPRAHCANVGMYQDSFNPQGRRVAVHDTDFVHFEGLRSLNKNRCYFITDGAFVHLRGIHTLHMSDCYNTDAAMVHIVGIQRLNDYGCDQLTDAAFVHLRGIHTLSIAHCYQPAISDAAFVHLKGIHALCMDLCDQASITGATLAQLKGGLAVISMFGCSANALAAARDSGLPVSEASKTLRELGDFF